MSFPFAFPTDKITADHAIAKFNDFASNFKFKEAFEAALRISFGPHYSIISTHSRRMNFYCEACRKAMNCVSALMAHNVSGPHVKNVDMQIRSTMEETMISLTSHFPRDSLQYALACSQAEILGVHLIEGYCVPYRRRSTATYFKCLLCGAHGKTEEILRHLKNDKHTDRYIKYHFQCKLSTFTPEVRESIRAQVAAREGIAINEIKTIMDRDGNLYPIRWEDEGLSEKNLLQKYARRENGKIQRSRASVSPSPSRSLPHSSSSRDRHRHLSRHERVKTEESASDRSESLIKQEKIEPKSIESPSGVIIERDSGVSRNDQGVQVFTDWVSETCLKKLKFVVHTHSLNESRVMSQEDAQACLELMFSIGTLLQHSLYSAKDQCSNQQRLKGIATMRENVNKMQGYVKLIFSEHWNATNAPVNCLEETLALWNLE